MVEIKKSPLTHSGHCPLRIPDQKALISYREVMMYQLLGSFFFNEILIQKRRLGSGRAIKENFDYYIPWYILVGWYKLGIFKMSSLQV